MSAVTDNEGFFEENEGVDAENISNDFKKQRSSKACDKCNKRKVKCDAEKYIPCSNCVKSGSVCLRSRPLKKRGPRPGYISMLENRLVGLESMLKSRQAPGTETLSLEPQSSFLKRARLTPPDISSTRENDHHKGSDDISIPSVNLNLHNGNIHLPALQPTSGCSYSTPPTSFSIPSVTSLPLTTDNTLPSTINKPTSVGQFASSKPLLAESLAPHYQLFKPKPMLESKSMYSTLLSYVNRSEPSALHSSDSTAFHGSEPLSFHGPDSACIHNSEPYLSPEVREAVLKLFFQNNLQWHSYLPENYVREQIDMSRFLFYSIFCMTLTQSPPEIRTPELVNLVNLLFQVLCDMLTKELDNPTVMTVLSLVMMCAFGIETGRGSASWLYLTMAVRISLDLQLNKECSSGSDESFSIRSVRRNVWWICYICDRYYAAGIGSSLLIKDEDCQVKLPKSDMDVNNQFDQELHRFGEDATLQIAIMSSREWYVPAIPNMGLRAYLLLLLKIYGKVAEYEMHLDDPMPARTDVENEYCLAALNASLCDWLASLPSYAKDITGQLLEHDVYGDRSVPAMVQYLHMLYNCVVITLHRSKMMRNIQTLGFSTASSLTSFKLCMSAANLNGILIARILAKNPLLTHVVSYASHCLYISGTVHVTCVKLSTDSSMCNLARENLRMHIRALRRIAQCISTAVPRLNELLSSCQSIEGILSEDIDLAHLNVPSSTGLQGPTTSLGQDSSPLVFNARHPESRLPSHEQSRDTTHAYLNQQVHHDQHIYNLESHASPTSYIHDQQDTNQQLRKFQHQKTDKTSHDNFNTITYGNSQSKIDSYFYYGAELHDQGKNEMMSIVSGFKTQTSQMPPCTQVQGAFDPLMDFAWNELK
ncbi:hypothetical protein RTP6_001665 [Batrachochytrium dendrobatidis]